MRVHPSLELGGFTVLEVVNHREEDLAVVLVDFGHDSRNFVSKFGRAKSYGAKTIGTPDAGAVSMAKFFAGLAK